MPRIRTYGLDIDTIRFAQRVKQGSGTTILPEPLKQINRFVVGIKKLKLWDSMVCWPMRSIHNAGTGSTVYSLGGQQIYNGSMVNSPTWSNRGILVESSKSSSVDIASFPISDLNTGPNFAIFFTPSETSPTASSEHLSLRYSTTADFIFVGNRFTGGTSNILCSFRSNDGNSYITSSAGKPPYINQPLLYTFSNKFHFLSSSLGSTSGSTSSVFASTRTSPFTLSITSRTGIVSSLLEFVVFFNNYNTVNNRNIIKDLYNKMLKGSNLYF